VPQYKRKLSKGFRWWYFGQYLGQRYFSKAIYLTKQEAARAERERIKELDEEARRPKSDLSLKALFEERLAAIKLSQSKKYHEENRRFLNAFYDEVGDVPVRDVSKAQVYTFLVKFAGQLKKEGKDNWKTNACIRVLKAAFNHAINIHELDIKNPVKGIKLFPVVIRKKYIPPEQDILAIRAACVPEQRLLIDFVDETACRIMEAIRFKFSDIDGDTITLYTRKSKNSNFTPRTIPRPLCLNGASGRGKVFATWNEYPRFLEEKIRSLKQKSWAWHSLRHRRASLWASKGMPIIEIMHRLGHSNMETTQRYLQLLGYTAG
jgi:integrase